MSNFLFFMQRSRGVALAAMVIGAAVTGCSPKPEPPPDSGWTGAGPGSSNAPAPVPATPVPAAPRVQPSFPASAAGFRFGIGLARAQEACGRRLTGTPQKALCTTPPVSLGFAKPHVELDFQHDKLTGVFVRATSWNAAWRALADEYAAPKVLVERVKGRWIRFVRHGAQWTQHPVTTEKTRHLSAAWALAGGQIFLLQANERVFVWYRSASAQ